MHLTLLLFLSFTAPIAYACLRYTARFPWDDTLPVTASITDNGVQTCWLNMTYKQHYLRQQYKNRNRGREEGVGYGDGDDGAAEWEFEDWDFSCVEGEKEGTDAAGNVTRGKYQARGSIGLGSVFYSAHGQEFWWRPKEREDIEGEAFFYTMSLWCKTQDRASIS